MKCRVCSSARLELAIDLGNQPWCNHFLKPEEVGHEPFYPLHAVYCHDCATLQLDYTVPKETMFGNHTYLSGITKSLSNHFQEVAAKVDREYFQNTPGKSVLDIGSNDGTQLKHYQKLGYDVLGVESSKATAAFANESGVPTLQEFFNLPMAQKLGRKFHVVNASGVFFHLEELHSVTEGIRECLHDDGIFVVQFLYLKKIVENLAFDQIYHEHLLYYNLANIEVLLKMHGMEMFDAYLSPIHGGSIIGYISKAGRRQPTSQLQAMRQEEVQAHSNDFATYLQFSRRIQTMKADNLAYLERARQAHKRVFGLGAPVKGNTLLNYFGVGTQYIQCLVEKNELRRGLISPGMHIPIAIEKELPEQPDIYYVLAWNFKREILANYQPLIQRGVEFYFPVNPQEV